MEPVSTQDKQEPRVEELFVSEKTLMIKQDGKDPEKKAEEVVTEEKEGDGSDSDGEGDGDSDDDSEFDFDYGYEEDEEIDLTEYTSEDVELQKLKVLQEKMDADYEKGLEESRDPQQLLELKSLRLTFLDIGPYIQNLSFFENLKNLFLQYNCISYIGPSAFQFNINIEILNLSHNQIM